MSRARALLFASTAAGILGLYGSACGQKTAQQPAPQPPAPLAVETAAPAPASTLAPPPTVRMRVQLEGLNDTFAAVDAISANWSETALPSDARTMWANALQGGGFKDSFIQGIDLNSRHDFDLRVPTTGSSSDPAYRQALTVHGAVAALDVAGVASGLPPDLAVSAIDSETWSAKVGEIAIVLKRGAKHLLIGRNPTDANASTALPSSSALDPGRRFAVQLSDMPKGLLADLASAVPDEVNAQAKKVIDGLETVTLAADLGVAKDATFAVTAKAPFEQLGLAMLGKPTQVASTLAARLPSEPIGALQMPWGDPKQALDLLHKISAQVPEPFAGLAQSAVSSIDGLAGQIQNEVIGALYLDSKGHLGLVLAAQIKDPVATDQAIDGLWKSVQSGASLLLAAQGNDKQFQFASKYEAATKIAGKAARTYSFALAPDHVRALNDDDDMRALRLLLDGSEKKPVLHAHTLVEGNVALLVIGSGGKAILESYIKASKKPLTAHLESDGGLARARASTQGCQVCITVDAIQSLRFLALSTGHNHKQVKKGNDLAKRFASSKLQGDFVFGFSAAGNNGRFAMSAPKEVLFAASDVAKSVRSGLAELDALDETPAAGSAKSDDAAASKTKTKTKGTANEKGPSKAAGKNAATGTK